MFSHIVAKGWTGLWRFPLPIQQWFILYMFITDRNWNLLHSALAYLQPSILAAKVLHFNELTSKKSIVFCIILQFLSLYHEVQHHQQQYHQKCAQPPSIDRGWNIKDIPLEVFCDSHGVE